MGQIIDTKFGTDVFNEMLLTATKFQSYNFYFFRSIKGEPAGGDGYPPTDPD